MVLTNVEHLLQPVSEAEPAGTSLEYSDPAYALLDRIAVGKPQQQIGESIIAGEEPDWNEVRLQASSLLERTKDLHVACHLTRALLERDGFAGFAQGLGLIRALLDRYWNALHPLLDPDDNNDPTIRISELSTLSSADMLTAVRGKPLIQSRAFGPVSVRDLAVAAGDATARASDRKVDPATIDGAFRDVDTPALEAIDGSLKAAIDALAGIDSVFERETGSHGPDLLPLMKLIRQAAQMVTKHLGERHYVNGTDAQSATIAQSAGGSAGPFGGEVTTRDDVLRAIEKIQAYYAREEPSSPIPLLLERCKRLVSMNFLDIVRDMAPDALSQVELIAGKRESG